MKSLPEVSVGSEEPLYNIGVVSRMTGVTMATLRAWERRYNFPESERTAGGHRLYSEKDVMQLQWVKGRIEEGMQTAQAINALRHQVQTGNLALVDKVPILKEDSVERIASPHLHSFSNHLQKALINRDIERADSILGEAVAVSSPDDLILDIIGPVIAGVGTAWEEGQISIASEHFATNYLRQRLLMWMMSGPPPRSIAPIVLACGPNEWHEGSLLILGSILRRRRWPIAYLGQALPVQDLASFVRDLKPSMVVVVAMTENTAAELIEWPQWMPEVFQTGKPIVGYGGRIFTKRPEWRLRMAGVYLGDTFRYGLSTIERLLVQSY